MKPAEGLETTEPEPSHLEETMDPSLADSLANVLPPESSKKRKRGQNVESNQPSSLGIETPHSLSACSEPEHITASIPSPGPTDSIPVHEGEEKTAGCPSMLTPYLPLDIAWLRSQVDHDPQSLSSLLNCDHAEVRETTTPFRNAIHSGALTYWNGSPTTLSWLGAEEPILMRDRRWPIPSNLERLCLDLVGPRSKVFRQTYCNSIPVAPEDKQHEMKIWFKANDPNNVVWTLDVRLDGHDIAPPSFLTEGKDVYTEQSITFAQKVNITPKYCYVDTHVDDGVHVLSICNSTCVKLWAIYPSTDTNWKHFDRVYAQPNRFPVFSQLAEGGLFFLQYPGDAIYLPAGTMHTVYTLAGGCLTGTTWVSNQSLIPSAHMFLSDYAREEKKSEMKKSGTAVLSSKIGYYNMLCALVCAVRKVIAEQSESDWNNILTMMDMICTKDLSAVYKGLESLVAEIESAMQKADLEVFCGQCGRGVVDHVRPKKGKGTRMGSRN